MYLDILKNPIFLAVLAGVITYLFLLWNTDNKKDPKSKKSVSLFTPIVVAAIVGVISYMYFNYTPGTSLLGTTSLDTTPLGTTPLGTTPVSVLQPSEIKKTLSEIPRNNVKELSSSDSPALFHLISRGVNIPNSLTIPDVFIETIY